MISVESCCFGYNYRLGDDFYCFVHTATRNCYIMINGDRAVCRVLLLFLLRYFD
jgi:hypothetical protein